MNVQEKFLLKLQYIVTQAHREKFDINKPVYLAKATSSDGTVFYSIGKTENFYLGSSLDPLKAINCTAPEFIEDIKKYLNHEDEHVHFKLDSLIKRKSILNFLYKEKVESPLLNKIFNAFLNSPYETFLTQELLELCIKQNDNEYTKKIVLLILDNYSHKAATQFPGSSSFIYNLSNLAKIDFSINDYGVLKHFFEYYKNDIISHQFSTEPVIIKFFKDKIHPHYWHEFSDYCTDKGFKKVEDNQINLFEVNLNPVLNLVVSTDPIRLKHPLITSYNDINTMIHTIIDAFNQHGVKMNIQKVFYSEQNNKDNSKYHLHFMSSDQNPLSAKKIQSIFSNMIDIYVEAFISNTVISSEFMEKAAWVAYMKEQLPEQTEKKSLKRKI